MTKVTAQSALAAYGRVAQQLTPTVAAALAPPAAAAASPAASPLDQTAEQKDSLLTRALIASGAFVILFVALGIVTAAIKDPAFKQAAKNLAATPVQGLTIFATFFVAAAAIERLLEPLSNLLPSAQDAKSTAETKLAAAGHELATTGTFSSLPAAAAAKADASLLTYWKTVGLWTAASVIAMIAAAFLRLYFLRTVGISNGTRTIEILATGLIIGSGTKPLHDLVTLISK